MSRKPMDFSMDVAAEAMPQAALDAVATRDTPEPSKSKAKPKTDDVKKSVGARVTTSIYRQLKSHAALSGATVQELVEEAIREKLDRIARKAA